jgi:hypothetical protein
MTDASLNPRFQNKMESLDDSLGETDSDVETESVATDGNDGKKMATAS